MMDYNYNYNPRGSFLRNIPQATANIILVNVVVWLMCCLRETRMTELFALFYPGSQYFHWWQPVTYLFMHGGFWHLLFNMYTFFIFGTALERLWGPRKFLLFYFITGLGAAALHIGVQAVEAQVYLKGIADGTPGAVNALARLKMMPTVGASGAIYGILMGYAMLYPDSVLRLIFPPVALSAKWFVIIFAVLELLMGLASVSRITLGGGIAHFAHLGGMLFGWLLIRWWKGRGNLYGY